MKEAEFAAEFTRFFTDLCRFDEHLGMRLDVRSPGEVSYWLTVTENHLSMPGACHGGVVAAMMDAVLGLTALSRVFVEGKMCQTVEFKINYFATAMPGAKLEGRGEVEFIGSSLVVTTATIMDTHSERKIAKGMGTFSLYPLHKNQLLVDLLPGQSGLAALAAMG